MLKREIIAARLIAGETSAQIIKSGMAQETVNRVARVMRAAGCEAVARKTPRPTKADAILKLLKEGEVPSRIVSMNIASKDHVWRVARAYRDHLGCETIQKGTFWMPPHIAAWIASITPEGATIHDTIRAVLVDAYNEENDK